MAFRSNDGFNLSLKGNSVQPSGNISSARNNSQSKQPVTPSRIGNLNNQMYILLLKISFS
jgi:hypothetical protein